MDDYPLDSKNTIFPRWDKECTKQEFSADLMGGTVERGLRKTLSYGKKSFCLEQKISTPRLTNSRPLDSVFSSLEALHFLGLLQYVSFEAGRAPAAKAHWNSDYEHTKRLTVGPLHKCTSYGRYIPAGHNDGSIHKRRAIYHGIAAVIPQAVQTNNKSMFFYGVRMSPLRILCPACPCVPYGACRSASAKQSTACRKGQRGGGKKNSR